MKPFLKWAGNKYNLRKMILNHLPYGSRYVEPFVGAGGVYVDATYPHYWLNDANQDLMHVYHNLKKHGELFINACESYFAGNFNNRESYNAKRSLYNRLDVDHIHKSVLFVYLNRHGFNGLCRYNAKGGFNVPFGKYEQPYFPRAEMLQWHSKLYSTSLTSVDFEFVLEQCGKGDVVYCDPPYYPTSSTANFTDYISGWKHDLDLVRFLQAAQEARKRGAYVVISNSNTQRVRDLYSNAGGLVVSHESPGMIAAKATSRVTHQELTLVLSPN